MKKNLVVMVKSSLTRHFPPNCGVDDVWPSLCWSSAEARNNYYCRPAIRYIQKNGSNVEHSNTMNFLLLFLLVCQLASDSARAAWKEEAATTHSYSSSIVPSSLRSLRDDDGRITTGITGQYNVIIDEDDGSNIPSIDFADGTSYILENLPDDFQASAGAQITLPEDAVFSSGGSIDTKGLMPSIVVTGTEELVSRMQTVLPKKDTFGKKKRPFCESEIQ